MNVIPFEESLDWYPELASPNLFCAKCKLVGETVKKQVNLTYEGSEKRPFIVFDPGSW